MAAQRCGIEPVWASEIEPAPIEITKKHFPSMVHLGDITQINGAEIEPVDIITAGSPCQDLSVAGKRAGLEGERSGLFMEFVRIVREMREATNGAYPKFIIWENVPGAFSSNRGQDFRAVLEEIMEAEIPMPYSGKWATSGMVRGNGRSLAWRVLDAQYWGVPQRRKRIFLVADFTGGSAAEILFEQEGVRGDFAESREAWQEVAATTRAGVEGAGAISLFDIGDRRRVADENVGVCPTLTTKMGTGGNNVPVLLQNQVVYGIDQQGGKGQAAYTEGVAPALCSDSHGTPHAVAHPLPFDTTQITSKQNGSNPKPGDPCHPLCATAHPPAVAFQPGNISRKAGAEPSTKVFPTLGATTQGDQFPHVALLGSGKDVVGTLMASCSEKQWLGNQEAFSGDFHILQPQVPFTQSAFGQYTEGVGTLRASGGDNGGGSETVVVVDCRNLRETEQSGTLQAKSNGGYSLNNQNPVRVGYAARRLTPTECERLMDFPDDWTVGHSDTARYRALGNSVAVPCVEWIMRQIAGRGLARLFDEYVARIGKRRPKKEG